MFLCLCVSLSMCVSARYVYTCTHVSMFSCSNMHICLSVTVFICAHVDSYVHVHACTDVHIYQMQRRIAKRKWGDILRKPKWVDILRNWWRRAGGVLERRRARGKYSGCQPLPMTVVLIKPSKNERYGLAPTAAMR